jgi:toxin ParE1/3/4
MRIVWSVESLDDLESLRALIGKDSPKAAREMALRIIAAVEQLLAPHPEIGRPGRIAGTRELVVAQTPYIVPYRIESETVFVLRVYHAARRRPDRL